MSDARDPSTPSGALTSDNPSSPGALLKLERERQGVTTQRIAADMHLSVAAIDAIEADRFASLGAPVFAKGHLRKYASLLNLAPDRVSELYDRLDGAPRQVDPIPQTQRAPEPALRPGIREMLGVASGGRPRASSLGPWIAVAALLVVGIGAAAWWYLSSRPQPETPSIGVQSPDSPSEFQSVETRNAAGPSSDSGSNPGTNSVSKSDESKRQTSIAPATVAATTTVPPSATVPPPRPARSSGTPPPGKIRLRLSFARESWVEVYDGGGNRMLYDVGRTDLPRTIDVEPPALVKFGDAAAVTTEANDKVVSIPQKNISGTVARFTIAADGSVQ